MKLTDTIPNEDGFLCPLKDIKKGDFFRVSLSENGAVFVRDDYDKTDKTYNAYMYEDVNEYRAYKGSKIVWSGFTY